MGDKPVKLGSLTLLLTVVLICLATLSVLALTTARADKALALKHAQMVQQVYETDGTAQQFVGRIDQAIKAAGEAAGYDSENKNEEVFKSKAFYGKLQALLPEEAVLNGDIISGVIQGAGNRQVTVELVIADGNYQITKWEPSVIWEPEATMDQLWDGK